MSKRLTVRLTLLSSFVVLGGCATVVRGTSQPFKVATEPPGATVTTTRETKNSRQERTKSPNLAIDTYGCTPTPCEFDIPRRSTFIAKIEKPDYIPVYVTVRSQAMTKTIAEGTTGAAMTTVAGSAIWIAAEGGVGMLLPTAVAAGVTGTVALGVGAPLIAIDAVSGSMLNLYPNPLSLKLVPKTESDLAAVHIDPDALIKKHNAEQQHQD